MGQRRASSSVSIFLLGTLVFSGIVFTNHEKTVQNTISVSTATLGHEHVEVPKLVLSLATHYLS